MPTELATDAERAAAAKIHPLRDYVVLKRVEYENPIIAVVGIKLNRGVVVSTGPGRRIRRMVHYAKAPGSLTDGVYLPDGKERVGKDGKPLVRAMRVAVGDVVEYSPTKHTLEFDIDGCTFVMTPEQSIYGKDTSGAQSQVILSQHSAGWEKGRGGAKDSFLAR